MSQIFSQTGDTTTILITPTPIRTIAIASPATISAGQNSILTVSNCGGTVRWSNGQVGSSITVSPTVTKTFYSRCAISGCLGDSSGVQVQVITATPTISVNKNTICNGDNSTLTGQGCAGTYEWSNTSTTVSILVTPNVTTNYTVVCISVNGRSAPASSTITVNYPPVKPTVTASSNSVILGQSVTLEGVCSAGSSYLWSTNETTNKITRTPTTDETVSLVCISGNGCVSEKNAQDLKVFAPNITVTASKATVCSGETVTLTVTGCPNNKTWNTGDNGNIIYTVVSQTTTYEVTCSFSSGDAKASATVIAIPLPNTPTLTNSNPSMLKGGKSLLTAKGCENGIKNWELYGVSTTSKNDTITVYPQQTNTFKVSCILNGCGSPFASTTVTVYSSDTKIFASPNQICSGDSSQLSLTNCKGTITWNNGKTGSPITVKPLTNTTYRAYCQITPTLKDSSFVEVKVIAAPSIITITGTFDKKVLSDKDTLALKSQVNLEVKGCTNGTVSWNIGTNGASIQVYPIETQTFIATCTNVNGCFGKPVSFKVNVRNTSLQLIISKSSICQGQYANIEAKGCPANQLSWSYSPIATDVIRSPTSISFKPGTTTKVVASCVLNALQTLKDSTIITVLPLNKVQTTNGIICVGNSIDLYSLINNKQLFKDLKFYDGVKPVTNIVTPVGVVVPFDKIYTVYATNPSGCIDSAKVTVEVKALAIKPLIKSDKISFPIIYGEKVALSVDNCNGKVTWINPAFSTNTITVSPEIKTTYKVVCVSNFGCVSDTSTITIDVKRQSAKIEAPSIICEETPFVISTNCTTNTLWGRSAVYTDGNQLTVIIARDKDSVTVKGKPIFSRVVRNDSTFIVGQATCFFQDIPTTFKAKPVSFEVFVPSLVASDFYFYPNPATNLIKIGSNSCLTNSLQVRIWDLIGRNLYDSSNTPMKDNEIDISNLASGQYVVEIILYNKDKSIKKLIKYTKND